MKTTQRWIATATAVTSIAVLSACASPYNQPYNQPYPQQQGSSYPAGQQQGNYAQLGTVSNVQMVRGQGGNGLTGAVVGGVVGGLAGNQVGGGRGRTAATIAGVAAGALIGNAVEQNSTRTQGRDYYRVTVQMDNGRMENLDYADAPNVRIGDRVRLDGNQLYR